MIDRQRLCLFKYRVGIPNKTVTILHRCAHTGRLSHLRLRPQRCETGTGSSSGHRWPWWQLTGRDSARCDAGHRQNADKVSRAAAREWSQVAFVAGRRAQKKPGPVNGARLEMPAWGPANLRGELAAERASLGGYSSVPQQPDYDRRTLCRQCRRANVSHACHSLRKKRAGASRVSDRDTQRNTAQKFQRCALATRKSRKTWMRATDLSSSG